MILLREGGRFVREDEQCTGTVLGKDMHGDSKTRAESHGLLQVFGLLRFVSRISDVHTLLLTDHIANGTVQKRCVHISGAGNLNAILVEPLYLAALCLV